MCPEYNYVYKMIKTLNTKREKREKMSIQEKPFAEQVYPCYNL